MKVVLLGFVWLGALILPVAGQGTSSKAPTAKIRVLLVDGFSNHDWRKTTALLESIIRPTGLFELTISHAPATADAPGYSSWRPNFKAYDVVIQTCNDINRSGPDWPKEVEADFESFVRDGGGVFIFHGAQNAFAKWPAYNEIIGLGWRPVSYGTALRIDDSEKVVRIPPGEGRGTSHGPNGDVVVRQLGHHPIHEGMPRAWMTPHLEVYFNARGPAENVEVLSYGRDPKFGENWPVEWTVNYGRGRAYVATFGHVWKAGPSDNDPESEALRCVGVQTTIVRVLQWLGQKPVNFPVPADFPTESMKSLRPLPRLDLPAPESAAPVSPAAVTK